jgi:replicative DNA helicase
VTLADIGAEAGLLGYYLERGSEGFSEWPVRAFAFTNPQHRAVFNAMERLAERGESIEPLTVLGELQRRNEGVRAEFLAGLVASAATSGGEVVHILEDLATRRAMVRAGEHLRAAAQDGTELPANSVEKILSALAQETAAVGRLDDAPVATALEAGWLATLDLPEHRDGITTGLLDLDHRSPGELPRGEVTIVGARTGVGKSAFVAQVAAHNARRGRHVLFASAEMTAAQLLDRYRASAAGVPLERLRTRTLNSEERRRLETAEFQPVRLFDKAGMTTADIRALVARFAVMQPLDLIVVDHLHHLADPLERGESRYHQVGRMVASLKESAKRHGCVMVVAAQLNRQAADREPSLADLRDAGTIEEFASVVLLLHRSESDPTICNVDIAKHRNGPRGRVRLYYDAPVLSFRDHTSS